MRASSNFQQLKITTSSSPNDDLCCGSEQPLDMNKQTPHRSQDKQMKAQG
jgi:hypothetical protein